MVSSDLRSHESIEHGLAFFLEYGAHKMLRVIDLTHVGLDSAKEHFFNIV